MIWQQIWVWIIGNTACIKILHKGDKIHPSGADPLQPKLGGDEPKQDLNQFPHPPFPAKKSQRSLTITKIDKGEVVDDSPQ